MSLFAGDPLVPDWLLNRPLIELNVSDVLPTEKAPVPPPVTVTVGDSADRGAPVLVIAALLFFILSGCAYTTPVVGALHTSDPTVAGAPDTSVNTAGVGVSIDTDYTQIVLLLGARDVDGNTEPGGAVLFLWKP